MSSITIKIHRKSVRQYKNLEVFPISIVQEKGDDHLLLDEALKSKVAEITEVNESGSVPNLMVANNAPKNLLIIDGEELVGAKQNRIVNVSILIAAGTKTVIPVSCVEQSRWNYRSRKFRTAGTRGYTRIRRELQSQVSTSLKETGERQSDQGAIWQEVDRKLNAMSVSSGTSAMHEVFLDRNNEIKEFRKHMRVPRIGTGVIVAINGTVWCLDVFDDHGSLSKMWKKLMSGYVLDAIESQTETCTFSAMDASALDSFLTEIQNAPGTRFNTIGLGEEWRFESEHIAGTVLNHEGRVVHMSGFSKMVN